MKSVKALSDESDLSLSKENGRPRPLSINPEPEKQREKRLAKRKARTLNAFQTTYENRRRKAL